MKFDRRTRHIISGLSVLGKIEHSNKQAEAESNQNQRIRIKVKYIWEKGLWPVPTIIKLWALGHLVENFCKSFFFFSERV